MLEKGKPAIFIKNIADPKKWSNGLALAIKRKLAQGPVVVYFNSEEFAQQALHSNVKNFGENARIEPRRVFTFDIEVLKLPFEYESTEMNQSIIAQIPGTCNVQWRGNKKGRVGTLIVSTRNNEAYKMAMKRGWIMLEFKKFKLDLPNIKNAICWNCKKRGHTYKISHNKKAKKTVKVAKSKPKDENGGNLIKDLRRVINKYSK